jgi:hypothetical protein
MHAVEISVTAASCVACTSTLFVMATYFTFPQMRKKRFMKFIFFMSSCDFIVAVMGLLGFPSTGTLSCYIQGIFAVYFSLCSWLWTVALSYVTFCLVITGKSVGDVPIHIVCWLLPAAAALLPFANATYGAGDGQWCIIVNRHNSPASASLFWSYVSYFGWLFFSSALMIYWAIIVSKKLYLHSSALTAIVKATYQRVALYPLVMMLCWLLNYVCVEFAQSDGELAGLSVIFGVSYGTASSLIFIIKSDEARRRWYDLLCKEEFGFESSTGDIPIDFEDDQFNEPFTVSGMIIGSIPNSRLASDLVSSTRSAASANAGISNRIFSDSSISTDVNDEL